MISDIVFDARGIIVVEVPAAAGGKIAAIVMGPSALVVTDPVNSFETGEFSG